MNTPSIIIESPHIIHGKKWETINGAITVGENILKTLLTSVPNTTVLTDSTKSELTHYFNNNHIPYSAYMSHSDLENKFNSTPSHPIDFPHLIYNISVPFPSYSLSLRNISKSPVPYIGQIHSLSSLNTLTILRHFAFNTTIGDGLIVPSESSKRICQDWIEDWTQKPCHLSIRTAPFGVDTSKFKPVSSNLALKKRFNLPADKTVVLSLARLNPKTKTDIFVTIQNFSHLLDTQSGAYLWIVGESTNKDYLKFLTDYIKDKHLEGSIRIDTSVDHNAIETYMQASDIFLSMSDHFSENFGVAPIEGMSCGLPVILTDIAGQSAHIQHGIQGYLIPTIGTPSTTELDTLFNVYTSADFGDAMIQSIAYDNNVFREKLNQLIESPSLRTKMGVAARKNVLSKFSNQTMAQNYQQAFNLFIKNAPPKNEWTFPTVPFHAVASKYSQSTTSKLDSSTILTLSSYGQKIMQNHESFYGLETHLNNFPLAPSIFNSLVASSLSKKELEKSLNLEPSYKIDATIMYLIKHNVINCITS